MPYRLSTFKEAEALQLSEISLASHADVLTSSSRVPAPPTSAETSDYKRLQNIHISMLLPPVGILQQKGQRNAMCENSRINLAGIQESLQTKLDRFLLTHKATTTALGTLPRELHMNSLDYDSMC